MLWELVFFGTVARAAQGHHGVAVGAGSSTNAKVDPSWIEGFEHGELFGDNQRRMVGQHHPARSHPDLFGVRRQVCHQDRRLGAGHRAHVVMFGNPEPGEPQPIGELGQLGCGGKSGRARFAVRDKCEVQDRERHTHEQNVAAGSYIR